MKYAALMIGILAVLVVVGFIAYRLFNSRYEGFGGFRDWVKNPDYKQAAADYFDARDSLDVPDDISSDEIQEMVDRLFVQKNVDFNVERLELVGERAVPMLIKALDDPKTPLTQFGEGDHVLDSQSPFERITDILLPFGPVDAALPLAKYIDHEDDRFRKYAAMSLGNIGSSECIAPMLTALKDDDDDVRSFAMMGIERGMEDNRCSEEFLNAMFPALIKSLNRDTYSVSGNAPKLLLAIDADRAMPVLLSPEYFSVENNMVHYIIQALNAAGHKIPLDTLSPFIEVVKPLADNFPQDYEYAEALIAYAHNPDASAEQTFRDELNSPNKRVQEAAANALAILYGVTNARDVVFNALDNHGFDRLSPSQKCYFTVFLYDSEVNNGGHAQYFVNSAGDDWESALEGLKEIGANERAKILHEATSLFGADGPPVDNDTRHRRLSRFSKQQNKSLDELDNRFHSSNENIEALLALYALKDKEHFTAQK